MKKRDRDDIKLMIDDEGFDSGLIDSWARFEVDDDPQFNELRTAYLQAEKDFWAYIEEPE